MTVDPADPTDPTDPISVEQSKAGLPEDGNASMNPAPADITSPPRWNESPTTTARYLVALFSFLINGMNDASTGALIPYLEPYYGINKTVISTVFVAPAVGCVAAALVSGLIHFRLGQRGIAVLGPIARLVGYIPAALHPPFPVLPVALLFAAFGDGLVDSGWNAWIGGGGLRPASELMGILQACYGLGLAIGPLVATTVSINNAAGPWYRFYYIMAAASVLELACAAPAFWAATGPEYRQSRSASAPGRRTTTREVLRNPVVWLFAFFFLALFSGQMTISGWIVTFMLEARGAGPLLAGLTATAFSLGVAAGRLAMGFLTPRIGERLAGIGYLTAALLMTLLSWFIPGTAAAVVIVILLGIFYGPIFPTAIVALTGHIPVDQHVVAIGFIVAFATGGSAVPFVVGAVAQRRGVTVLQPFMLAVIGLLLVIWLAIPGKKGAGDEGEAEAEGVGEAEGMGLAVGSRGRAARVLPWLRGGRKS